MDRVSLTLPRSSSTERPEGVDRQDREGSFALRAAMRSHLESERDASSLQEGEVERVQVEEHERHESRMPSLDDAGSRSPSDLQQERRSILSD